MFEPHNGQCPSCPQGTVSLIIVKKGFCFRHNEEYKEGKKSPQRKENDRLRKEAQFQKALAYRPKPRKVTGEGKIFNEIWDERPHVCQVCSQPVVRKKNSVGMFSHVLSKGAFPELRLDKENILIKGDGKYPNCNCHRKWEERTAEMRDIPMWQPIFRLQELLKQKANNLK